MATTAATTNWWQQKMIATGSHTQNSTNWQHTTSSSTDRSSDGCVDHTTVSSDSNCKSQQITFETKQSTIDDNSCNNQPVATKSSGNWRQQKQQEQLPIRQPEAALPESDGRVCH